MGILVSPLLAPVIGALLPQHDQSSLGMLMFVTSLVMLLCWWPLSRHPESGKQTVTG
ncbi:hypothetical protein E05_31850 [Plautia stali symbiont]|nr:hypothetical protein E05_31850 [Plautia stali symbiont]